MDLKKKNILSENLCVYLLRDKIYAPLDIASLVANLKGNAVKTPRGWGFFPPIFG